MPRIVEPTPDALSEAARILRAGGVVAFPTETVYGLGAVVDEASAIDAVFALKGRPTDNPLIVHVLGPDGPLGAAALVATWDDRADALARRFWPGPLTLVLPRSSRVPDRVTAGLGTVAVRAPRHPVARALLEAVARPLAAPSANRSGHVSPTRARHVADDFAAVEDLVILDGGPAEVGLESTVLDLSGPTSRILRPGSVTTDDLSAVIGPIDIPSLAGQAASPGTSPRHYAPDIPTELVPRDALAARLDEEPAPAVVLCLEGTPIPARHHPIRLPSDPAAYAHHLYDALRQAESHAPPRILIERPPPEPAWAAVHDRLARASRPAEG